MGGGGAEESDPENPERDDLPKQQSGMSQSVQNDIGVCVVIILITVLAIIVTGKHLGFFAHFTNLWKSITLTTIIKIEQFYCFDIASLSQFRTTVALQTLKDSQDTLLYVGRLRPLAFRTYLPIVQKKELFYFITNSYQDRVVWHFGLPRTLWHRNDNHFNHDTQSTHAMKFSSAGGWISHPSPVYLHHLHLPLSFSNGN